MFTDFVRGVVYFVVCCVIWWISDIIYHTGEGLREWESGCCNCQPQSATLCVVPSSSGHLLSQVQTTAYLSLRVFLSLLLIGSSNDLWQ